MARSAELLEDRALLAVAIPGGAAAVAAEIENLIPDQILTSVNDALAGGNSSALLYAAFDGESNRVRISGSYLNLFLLVDDDTQVPVVRVPPVFNKALLQSFAVTGSLDAFATLNGVMSIGVAGEIGVGYELAPVVGQLVARASLDANLGVGIQGAAGFGINLPVIELLGGIPDVQAIVPNPSALGSIFDAVGLSDLVAPLDGLFDLVDGVSNGFIAVPDFSFPDIRLPDILDFSSITGVSLPFPLDIIPAFAVADFVNPFEDGFTIPGFDIPIGSQVGDLIATIPGFDILTGIASFFSAIANANESIRINLGDMHDSADVSTVTVNTVVDGGDGNDTLLAGFGDDSFIGGSGDDFLVWNVNSDGDHDSFLGGSGNDVFVINGTPGDDVIHLFAAANGDLARVTRGADPNNPLAETIFDTWSDVNQIQITGNEGNLTVVVHGDLDLDQGVKIVGGTGISSLVLISDGNTPDFTVPILPDDATGSVTMDGMEVQFTGINGSITLDADHRAGIAILSGTNAANDLRFRGFGTGNAEFTNDTQVPILLKDFDGGSSVVIRAFGGDDFVNIALNGVDEFENILLDAGGPLGANTLRFEGSSGDDKFEFTPDTASRQDGVVVVDDTVIVTFQSIEDLFFVGGDGFNRLDVEEPTAGAADFIIVSPTNAADGTLFDISTIGGTTLVYGVIGYHDIEDLRIQTGTGRDIVQANTANTPGVNAIGTIGGGNGVTTFDFTGFPIRWEHDTSVTDILDVEGGTVGDDLFTITPGVGLNIEVNLALGRNVINYNADAAGGAVTVDYSNDSISQVGFGSLIHTGLVFLNLDADNQHLDVFGTSERDVVVVTPLGPDSGHLELANDTPLLDYTSVQSILVDGGASDDVLVVNGSAVDDVILVDGPGRRVNVTGALPVDFDGFDSLTVQGREGTDQVTVVPDALIPIFIAGGLPIGATTSNPAFQGDRLKVDLDGENDLIFHAGPEGDAGTYVVGSRAPISFDEIESIDLFDVGPNGAATVNGTNGDDQVTIIGTGNGNSTVSVNNGPAVVYPNIPTLTLESISGDDFIAIQTIANWNLDITVVGGGFTSHTDLRLTTPGTETVTFTPTGSLEGTVGLSAAVTAIDITGIQQIEYDGQGDNDLLVMQSLLAVNNTFVLVPGGSFDDGSLQMDDLMALVYQRLGAGGRVSVVGGGGIDELRYDGTGFDDDFEVFATDGHIDQRHATRDLVDVFPNGIEGLRLEGLGGDDEFQIHSAVTQYTSGITVIGGDNGGGSDTLTMTGTGGIVEAFVVTPAIHPQDGEVSVNAVITPYTGIEHIYLSGNVGDADTLLVNDDRRDNTWDVSAGTVGDLVQIDGRESIDFNRFRDVTLTNGFGTDLFRVWPTNTKGYTNSLTVNGDAARVDDVLEVYGTPAADTVTTTASVITTNTRPVTAGVNLVELKILTLGGNDTATVALSVAGARNVIDLGAGNDTLTAAASSGVAVYGGEGDDSITASNAIDTIYGDAGNDTILALDGADRVDGGLGNDSITGGVGDDFLFGGDGSDRFIWNNGDNSDTVEGNEGVDVQIVNGAAGGDVFNLRTATDNQARSFFERSNLVPFTIDMAAIEQVDINGLGGPDAITVRDLDTTEMRQVNVNVGAAADLDTVAVDGRTVDDNVTLTAISSGVVNIAGLQYDVDVASLNSTTDLDTLTFNAREGNDTVVASDGLNGIFGTTLVNVNHLTINGGEGNDSLTGFGQLNGDAGDDSLFGGNFAQSLSGGDGADSIQGGGGDDVLNGNAGEDSFIGGSGNDTIDGGADWDAILINGTSGADTIDVNQTAATMLVHRVNATTETDTLVLLAGARTVEEARVDAGSGADTIRVRVTDSAGTNLIDATLNALQMTVHGGDATGAGDRLIVVDDGPADHSRDDLTIYRKSQDDSAGTVTVGPGNPEAFENVFDGIERVQFLDGSGTAVSAEPGSTSRLVVFKHDPFEYNDDRFTATHVGANSVVNVDPTIDPGSAADPFGDGTFLPGDVDWYRVEATVTGTLDVQAFFEEIAAIPSSGRPGLPNNGNLQIEIYDADGFVNGVPLAIAGNGPNFGINDGAGDTNLDGDTFLENERIRIPVVAGQVYYLRVFGATAAGVTAINNYNLTLINEAPPTPFDLELADNLVLLTGSQVVPAVATTASGTANFQYNAVANTFDLDLFVSGVELTNVTALPELTAAHIHNGAIGVNGPVIVSLPIVGWVVEPAGIRLKLTGAAFSGVAGDITALLAGNTYFDIHTTAAAGGEIRGQIHISNVLGVSDSGRSQFDNTTKDNTPTIFLRVDDAGLLNDVPGNAAGVPGAPPVDEVITIPFNPTTGASPVGLAPGYRVAIYDETDTHAPVLLGFAQPVANLRGVYSFTFPNALTDGSHFISAKVQMIDPADNDTAGTLTRATGFGPRSQSLEIVVDTIVPPVFFGVASDPIDGLAEDQGVIPQQPSFIDKKTNDQTPTIWGTAEANAVVRVYADLTPANGVDNFDLLLGVGVAVPNDGTNAYPNGQWTVTSLVDLNNPAHFPVDGLRRLLVTAEDLAGNLNPSGVAAQALTIFLDTQGPQVTNVQITTALAFDLFDPKPSLGPTPRTDGLTISFRDFPIREIEFPNPAINPIVGVNPGHYILRGDANGVVPIQSITFIADPSVPGQVATGRVELTFFSPLLDDRYTLTINDDVVDDVGNKLDGESNAIQPLETPTFPSGDGQPGGDFVARFTIDSRSEIGAVGQAGIFIDINGNYHFDPTNVDHVNRDLVFEMGINTDRYVAGKFTPAAAVIQDGFDRIASYGLLNKQYRWLIDFTNDGRPDYSVINGLQINATPISGDFNSTHVGDEIGLFDGKKWYLDTNANNNIDAGDRSFTGTMSGTPITGDFDGDGKTDLAVHSAQLNTFYFDLTTAADSTPGILDGNTDDTINFSNPGVPGSQTLLFPGVLERPFAGDFNLDGITDIGLMLPNRDGASPSGAVAEYYIIHSIAAAAVPGTAAALNHQFAPKPLGVDLFAQFGRNVAVPLVGNFDPPVTPSIQPIKTPLEVTLPSVGGPFQVLRVGDNLHVRKANGSELIAARPLSGLSNVRIVGSNSSDTVVLDASLNGFAEIFQIEGGNGADKLDTSRVDFAVAIDGGIGNDTLLGGSGHDFFAGGTGNDRLDGGNGNDVLNGQDGNDSILGGDDNDTLSGGVGNDTLDGGAGHDGLHGDVGNDKLLGNTGNDTVRGGANNDSLDGGADDDVLLGEEGNDTILGGTGDAATDAIDSRGDDILSGGAGNDSLSGQDGDDVILGGSGNDKLFGGNGHDTLSGEDGIDTLAGDAGTDLLFGGQKRDTFIDPAIGEKDEDGIFADLTFFARLDALLATHP